MPSLDILGVNNENIQAVLLMILPFIIINTIFNDKKNGKIFIKLVCIYAFALVCIYYDIFILYVILLVFVIIFSGAYSMYKENNLTELESPFLFSLFYLVYNTFSDRLYISIYVVITYYNIYYAIFFSFFIVTMQLYVRIFRLKNYNLFISNLILLVIMMIISDLIWNNAFSIGDKNYKIFLTCIIGFYHIYTQAYNRFNIKSTYNLENIIYRERDLEKVKNIKYDLLSFLILVEDRNVFFKNNLKLEDYGIKRRIKNKMKRTLLSSNIVEQVLRRIVLIDGSYRYAIRRKLVVKLLGSIYTYSYNKRIKRESRGPNKFLSSVVLYYWEEIYISENIESLAREMSHNNGNNEYYYIDKYNELINDQEFIDFVKKVKLEFEHF